MKYLGYVYVLALALDCPPVLFPLPLAQGCCPPAQVCPSSAPVLLPGWEPCGPTVSVSPRANYVCVLHFTEWGKNSNERLLA